MKNEIKILLFVLLVLCSVNIIYADDIFPIIVRPLTGGAIVPSTTFNYTFNFTIDSACTNVVFSNVSKITTDAYGIGSVNINITNMSTIPYYMCEYKNGALRATHKLGGNVYDKIRVNQTISNVFCNGSVCFSISDLINLYASSGNWSLDSANVYSNDSRLDNKIVSIGNWSADKSSYVPYTGADKSVNLGINNLTANQIWADTTNASYIASSAGAGALDIRGDPWFLSGADLEIENGNDSRLILSSSNIWDNGTIEFSEGAGLKRWLIQYDGYLSGLHIFNDQKNKDYLMFELTRNITNIYTDLLFDDGFYPYADKYCDNISCYNLTYIYNTLYPNTGGQISGDVVITGNLTILGTFTNASVAAESYNGSLTPAINHTFDLGNQTHLWSALYVGNVFALNMYNQTEINTFLVNIYANDSRLENKIDSIGNTSLAAITANIGNWTLDSTSVYSNDSMLNNKIASIGNWTLDSTSVYLNDSRLENKMNSIGNWSLDSANVYSNDSRLENKINSIGNWTSDSTNVYSNDSRLDKKIDSVGNWTNTSILNLVSANITISATTFNVTQNMYVGGNLHIEGNFSAKRPYLTCYDNSTQSFLNTSAVQVMNVSNNNGDSDSYLVGVEGMQNITFNQTGDYLITVSPEFYQASGTNKIITFWIQKTNSSGVFNDVAWSNSRYTITNGQYFAPSIFYQVDISNTTNDKIRVMWYSDSTSTQIISITGLTAPTRPSIPGVLLNVQKVSEITD